MKALREITAKSGVPKCTVSTFPIINEIAHKTLRSWRWGTKQERTKADVQKKGTKVNKRKKKEEKGWPKFTAKLNFSRWILCLFFPGVFFSSRVFFQWLESQRSEVVFFFFQLGQWNFGQGCIRNENKRTKNHETLITNARHIFHSVYSRLGLCTSPRVSSSPFATETSSPGQIEQCLSCHWIFKHYEPEHASRPISSLTRDASISHDNCVCVCVCNLVPSENPDTWTEMRHSKFSN